MLGQVARGGEYLYAANDVRDIQPDVTLGGIAVGIGTPSLVNRAPNTLPAVPISAMSMPSKSSIVVEGPVRSYCLRLFGSDSTA